jgi:hypothetical protein
VLPNCRAVAPICGGVVLPYGAVVRRCDVLVPSRAAVFLSCGAVAPTCGAVALGQGPDQRDRQKRGQQELEVICQ